MDDIKKKFQLVVARYNEDIKWLLPFSNITIIYNKGDNHYLLNNFNTIKLKNVGRESHTYLYHIIENYNNLPDKIIFFQGKIDDHKILEIEQYFGKDDYIGKFSKLKNDKLKNKIEHYGKWEKQYNDGTMKICNYTPYDWLEKIIGLNLSELEDEFNVVWGANFSINKNIILSKPKSFYENIIRHIDYHPNPEEGHFLERSWYLIFNKPIIPKNMIGYIFFKNEIKEIDKLYDNYEEIHLWNVIKANYELGIKYKIFYTPNNNKYLSINPNIYRDTNIDTNQNFYLDIKGSNDAHILIEFQDSENRYEIVFGGWDNNRSVIRDFNIGKILIAHEGKILDKNIFIRFHFTIGEKIIIKKEDEIIFEIENIFYKKIIKNIKIKSYFNSDIYWNYDDKNNILNNKFKIFMSNNIYEDIKHFYSNNYLDNYVEEINLCNF